ncbi:zinc finger MYM-type protein 1-like, partial [Aphis craccivora]
MNQKKKLSGAANKKRKLQIENNISKLPKIFDFFSKQEIKENEGSPSEIESVVLSKKTNSQVSHNSTGDIDVLHKTDSSDIPATNNEENEGSPSEIESVVLSKKTNSLVSHNSTGDIDVLHKTDSSDIPATNNEENEGSLSEIESVVLSKKTSSQVSLNKTGNIDLDIDVLHKPDSSDIPGFDPGLWNLDEKTRDYICRNGFSQNINADFTHSKKEYLIVHKSGGHRTFNRYLNKDWFKTVLVNGEICQRDYLSYSETNGSVYCIPCYLFENQTVFSKKGFSNWKYPEKLKKHENSEGHKICVYKMKQRATDLGRIDTIITRQLKIETNYWINVLTRVCSVVKSLASHGLPFRGTEEKYGSSVANSVLETIFKEVKAATYFSISIDSTPDITHIDQLSFIIRYVLPNGEPVERFIGFIGDAGHKAESLTDAIFSILKKYDLNVCFLRGQSYDNAKNMSGIYSGVQARIKDVISLADFVPCSAHSLNLIGMCAASCCEEANNFFSFIQNLYVYFSSSTYRWSLLKKYNNSTLKSLSDTRWSARDDACHSLKTNWAGVKKALLDLKHDKLQKPLTRSEAEGLLRQLNRLETSFMTEFWNDVLHTFNKTSKLLQSVQIDLSTVVELYNSLVAYVKSVREMFQTYEDAAKEKFIDCNKIPEFENKLRRRKKHFDESNDPGHTFDSQNNFKINTFYVICDNLTVELNKRKSAYDSIISKYSFILKIYELDPSKIREDANKLRTIYKQDLDESFENECVHFQSVLKLTTNPPKTLLDMSKFIKEKQLVTIFPYVDVALRMFLCNLASNCSTERSFSTLRRIKNYLRSSMSSERLNSLAVLNIEATLTKSLNYSDVIKTFAAKQARKKKL